MTLRRSLVRVLLALVGLLALLAAAGSARDWHVVTVTRTTDADPEVLWRQWSDVDARTDWDHGLTSIDVDGGFAEGSRGTVQVEGQDPVDYEIVEVDPGRGYTDRFESLAGTHTDWHHTMTPNGDGTHDVTWRLEARGPLALASLPVLRQIFGEEVPGAVDEYVDLAEARTRGGGGPGARE